MRFRRRAFGRRAGKRTVAWVDGLSGFDSGAAERRFRNITFTPVVAGGSTWGAAIVLVNPTDLTEHGGEDAVVTRIRGSLRFLQGRQDSGAGFAAASFPIRVSVVQSDTTRAGLVMPFEFTGSEGLGRDDILWTHDVVVSSVAMNATGTNLEAVSWDGRMLEVDVKARRKVQVDRQILIWFQTVVNAGVTQLDCLFGGSLRTLVMRPR